MAKKASKQRLGGGIPRSFFGKKAWVRCIRATTIPRRIDTCVDLRVSMTYTTAMIVENRMADVYGIEKVWAAIYEGNRQHGDFSSKESKPNQRFNRIFYALRDEEVCSTLVGRA